MRITKNLPIDVLREQCARADERLLDKQIRRGTHVRDLLLVHADPDDFADALIGYTVAVEERCRGTMEVASASVNREYELHRRIVALERRVVDLIDENRELRRELPRKVAA